MHLAQDLVPRLLLVERVVSLVDRLGVEAAARLEAERETTTAVTCALVVLDQALNDRNDGLNCLPAMTGDNPFTQFTD